MLGTKAPPPSSRVAVQRDSKEILSQIKELLGLAVQLHDYDRVLLYIRRLNSYLDSQYEFDANDCLYVVTVLFPFVVSTDAQQLRISMPLHSQCMSSLATVLRKKRLLRKLDGFSLPWRPLFDTLAAVHLNTSKRLACLNVTSRSANATTMVKLIKRAKRWFPSGSSKEIRQAVETQLSPFDNRYFQAQAILNIFLPVNRGNLEDGRAWLPRYVEMLNWADHCPTSFLCWIWLFARYAKHECLAALSPSIATGDSAVKKPRLQTSDSVDWSVHLNVILNGFLQSIGLNVAGEAPKEHNRQWPTYWFLVSHMGHNAVENIAVAVAKLVVYTIRRDNKTSEVLLEQLMTTVSTYYHPSNHGQWTPVLAIFLRSLGAFMAKRRLKERKLKDLPPTYKENDLFPYDTKLAEIILPTAMTALYGKSELMVAAGERVLRNVAYIFPDLVFPNLLKHVQGGLETVVEPNRMMSALKCMAVVTTPLLNRSVYPKGPAHLQQLLWLALPGVEATDPIKTSATLAFLSIIFYSVPFIDARESHPNYSGPSRDMDAMSYGDDDDDTDASRKATFTFKDWCSEFLERIIKVVNIQDKFSKKSFADQAFLVLLKRAMRGFFECVSRPVYQSCVDRLARVISDVESPNARKFVGALIAAASPVYPRVSLPRLFLPLFNRLFSEAKGSKGYAVSNTVHTSDLQWGLYMLACTISHAGGAGDDKDCLLPYMDKIQAAYELTAHNTDKMVRKMSNKLLRSALVAATQVYPAEYRAFDPQTWAKFEAADGKQTKDAPLKHWEQWASFGYDQLKSDSEEKSKSGDDDLHELDLKISWHEPTKAELQAATDLVNSCSTGPLSVLEGFLSGSPAKTAPVTESKKDKEESDGLSIAITQLVNLARGATAVLGPLDGNLIPDKEDTSSRCPARSLISTRVFPHITRTESGGTVSLRTSLARFAHKLVGYLTSPSVVPNVQAMSRSVKLIRYLLTVDCVRDNRIHHSKHVNNFLRKWQTEFFTSKKCTLRALLIQRAYIVHQTRLASQTFSWRYTDEAKALIGDLQKYNISDFAKVSGVALAALVASLPRSPREITAVVYSMLDVIKSGKSTDEQLTGAIQFLSDKTVVAWVCKKWNRLSAWMTTMATDAQQHKDDKVQVRLHALFQQTYPFFHMLPLHVSDVSSVINWPAFAPSPNSPLTPLTSDRAQDRNKALHFFNKKTQQMYRDLCNSLSSRGTERDIHWRYLMMVAAFMSALLRSDTHHHTEDKEDQQNVNQDLVMFFAQGLVNDLLPFRKISIQAFSKILMSHAAFMRSSSSVIGRGTTDIKESTPARDFDQTLTSEKEWLSTEFSDYVFSGWQSDSAAISCKYAKRPNASGSVSSMWSIDREFYPYSINYSNVGAFDFPQPADSHSTSLLNDKAHGQLSKWVSANFQRVVDSLVTDHPTLAAGTNPNEKADRASARGAGEDIAAHVAHATPSMGYKWPYSRMALQSDAFDKDHAYLMRGLVESFPSILLGAEAKETPEQTLAFKKFGAFGLKNSAFARAVMRLAGSTEQDQQVTASEMISGLLRGTRHWEFSKQRQVHELILAVYVPMLDSAQPQMVPHFQDSLRYMYSNADPRRLVFLSNALFNNAFGSSPYSAASQTNKSGADMDLEDILDSALLLMDSPAMQYKRLAYLNPVLIEQAWMSVKIGDWLLSRFATVSSSYLEHPYQQVREAMSVLLLFVIRNSFRPNAAPEADQRSKRAFYEFVTQRLVNSPNRVEGDAKEAELPKDEREKIKRGQSFLETVMYWLVKCNTVGDAPYTMDIVLRLLPSVLVSQKHPDPQCAAIAKYSSTLCAWASSPASQLSSTLQCLSGVAQAKSWSSRIAALTFIQTFVPRHSLLLSPAQVQDALKISSDLLTDPVIEVRTQSASTLTAILMSAALTEDVRTKLRKQFISLAKSKIPKPMSADTDAVVKRHAGVLGLSAIVNSNPYTLPEYMVSIVTMLADYANDPLPVSQGLVKLFAEFKRTHKERWEEFKEKFSEEDLEKLNEVGFTATYIA